MLLSRFKISGHSMEPEISDGAQVLVSNLPYFFKNPKVNDLIAVKYKKEVLIKRIKKIKLDEIFILGDNLADSLDSRKIGFIKINKILGKVVYKI